MISRTIVRLTGCLASSIAIAGCGQTHLPEVGTRTFPRPATAAIGQDSASFLSGVVRAAEANSRSVPIWPGFDPRDRVLLAVVKPDGPVLLTGDPAPPSDYHWVDAHRRVAVREGPPPDSLLGLQLYMDWNGRKGVATAVTFAPGEEKNVEPFLLHEGFHTYQEQAHARTPDKFKRRSNPAFPDTSVDALAQLNLEGAYLGRALLARESGAARALARTALALRMRRCVALGAKECANERGIEQREGTAVYVQVAMLRNPPGSGAPVSWPDSLARALNPVQNFQRLERWYFYDSGYAWLLLLDRFGPAGWKSGVEMSSPDEVLAAALGLSGVEADSLVRVARQSPLWLDARRRARDVVQREMVRRDSLERAFWKRPGVPIRVYFGRVTKLAFGQTKLPDGRLEQTFNFGSNQVTMRGPSRSICCPGAVTVAPVSGRVAQVNGAPVRLDQPGAQGTGTIVLDIPEIALRLESGELRVYPDSITIRAH